LFDEKTIKKYLSTIHAGNSILILGNNEKPSGDIAKRLFSQATLQTER
jgi:hypothetical protein